ncbi:MAG: hypothetical protein H6598_07655 [Flavobacteriales bacterium]|nr:hypothetical protein [Flavobacteriales bacterium]
MNTEEQIWSKLKGGTQRVEAPDHLFSRIQATIEDLNEMVTPRFAISFSAITVLVIILNITIAVKTRDTGNDSIDSSSELSLYPDNQIYDHD